MIVIGQVKFDFEMEDVRFALGLYNQWDEFCRISFTGVASRLLADVDRPDSVLRIESLDLDLGTLSEEEFYRKFPVRLEECMQEALRSLLEGARTSEVERFSLTADCCDGLMFYLLHGYLNWEHGDGAFDLKQALLRVVREESGPFQRFLLAEGHREALRKRLVFRLDDGMLGALVTLTAGGEAVFINRYTGFLIRNHPRLPRNQVSRKEYREVVWMLVLAYIWALNRSYISRKGLVAYTLREIAAHFGIGMFVLIGYLMRGVEEILAGDPNRHELLEILEEIRCEERLNRVAVVAGKVSGQALNYLPERFLKKILLFSGQQEEAEKDPEAWLKHLRLQLADGIKRRKLLKELPEQEIQWLVRILIPADSEFVLTYARMLESGKEKGMYEGKAGNEFRVVKWDFIFAVLLENSFANLDRKQFVADVLHRLAAHYGLEYRALVVYLKKLPEELPHWLREVLEELEDDGQQLYLSVLKQGGEGMTREDERRLAGLLKRPWFCRRLLGQLGEAEIVVLVKGLLPQDKAFVLGYAERLTQAKEQGMFEGRAGGEFRQLKWEFIFQLALSDVFNRKYFVLSVLQELAAHYGLDVRILLDYFYHYLAGKKEEKLVGLWQVICELWSEAKEGQKELRPVLQVENEWERKYEVLERYLLTGHTGEKEEDMYVLFMELKKHDPARLRNRMKGIPALCLMDERGNSKVGIKLYAALLLWWLEDDSCAGEEQVALKGMLQSVLAGSGKAGSRELRLLLACCLTERTDDYPKFLSGVEKIDFRFTEKDLPVLWTFLTGNRWKEMVDFVRRYKKEIGFLIFSSSSESRKFLNALAGKAGYDNELALLLKELWGWEEEVVAVAGKIEWDRLWLCLSARKVSPEQRTQLEKWSSDRRACLQVIRLLENNPVYQSWWIERVGNPGLRKLAGELMMLMKKINFIRDQKEAWGLLAGYTLPEYAYLPVEELFLMFIRRLWQGLSYRQREQLVGVLNRENSGFTLWKRSIRCLQYVLTLENPALFRERTYDREGAVDRLPALIEVRNAGLVLFSPWLVQLFKRLELLDAEGKAFTGVEARVRGVFILQALVDGTGEKDYVEQELFLNRLLVGLAVEEALPLSLELRTAEKELVESLAENLRVSWPKMKHTSPEGLRQSFLLREGVVEEQEKEWKLTVSQQGIDVLLDSLPWRFSMLKLPWMEKRIVVEWR